MKTDHCDSATWMTIDRFVQKVSNSDSLYQIFFTIIKYKNLHFLLFSCRGFRGQALLGTKQWFDGTWVNRQTVIVSVNCRSSTTSTFTTDVTDLRCPSLSVEQIPFSFRQLPTLFILDRFESSPLPHANRPIWSIVCQLKGQCCLQEKKPTNKQISKKWTNSSLIWFYPTFIVYWLDMSYYMYM